MRTFEFEIQEILSRTIKIKANNEDEAYQKLREMYLNEKIILDSSDYMGFKIQRILSLDEELEKDNLIAEIIDYLYRDEKKHYEEFPQEERPQNHIFLKIERLKKLIY